MQDLPYFKAFPSDWEQAMRRADIPAEDRGEVYRLIFFAWADGGLSWDDETAMRRYAKEMGWQWRRFSRTLDHYKRLCSPDSGYRLPIFLLRNFKQSLPDVSTKFEQSLPQVSSNFDQTLPEVSPEFDQSLRQVSIKFDAENSTKPNGRIEPPNKSEVRIQSHSQNPESEAEAEAAAPASPLDDFADPLRDLSIAIATTMGLNEIPEGPGAEPIHQAAEDFLALEIAPTDVTDYEKDFYQRKIAKGSRMVLTLAILRQDLPGWVRARRLKGEMADSQENPYAIQQTSTPPRRETHNARAARKSLELINELINEAGGDDRVDPENPNPAGLALDRPRR